MVYSVIVFHLRDVQSTRLPAALSRLPFSLAYHLKSQQILNQNRIRWKTGARLCLQSKTLWRQVSWSPILTKLGQGTLQKRWLFAKSAKALPKSRNVLLKDNILRLRFFNQGYQFFNLLGTGLKLRLCFKNTSVSKKVAWSIHRRPKLTMRVLFYFFSLSCDRDICGRHTLLYNDSSPVTYGGVVLQL